MRLADKVVVLHADPLPSRRACSGCIQVTALLAQQHSGHASQTSSLFVKGHHSCCHLCFIGQNPLPAVLQALHLEGCPGLLMDAAAAEGCQLEHLTLDACAVAANLDALCGMWRLRHLQLTGAAKEGSVATAAAVRRALAGLPALQCVTVGPGPSDVLRQERDARLAPAVRRMVRRQRSAEWLSRFKRDHPVGFWASGVLLYQLALTALPAAIPA